MHPPLASHKHQGCEHIIQALDDCHRSGLLNKYSGKCNDIKLKLNECLGEEFQIVRAENKQKAAAKREKIRQVWKDMEEPPAGFFDAKQKDQKV
ncbi:hypothetical protein K450DRAFT_216672 [Umbelopsis ramanniana AG]|uniref:COX assembly mitochondrial protein n=1 Tax=Umbelopsis ramanniana AG TaxID=1314678 RepID=A0AAD5EJH7_UMBRA|nr:uncharacterized protein K450DRAFT_216672 [Umbelopsis ramanniana AG]KAI8584502.1 hypothetical protein K450DRAFT_216672 [Umbelopsis ramanniana AG]